jgi:hypothetical protein
MVPVAEVVEVEAMLAHLGTAKAQLEWEIMEDVATQDKAAAVAAEKEEQEVLHLTLEVQEVQRTILHPMDLVNIIGKQVEEPVEQTGIIHHHPILNKTVVMVILVAGAAVAAVFVIITHITLELIWMV